MTIRQLHHKLSELLANSGNLMEDPGELDVEVQFDVPIFAVARTYEVKDLNVNGSLLVKNPFANLPPGH